MIGLLFGEDRFVARPTCHRSPDETFHEQPSQAFVGRRRRQGRIQRVNRLPVREGPPASQPEKDAARTAAARSARRRLGKRSLAAVESRARTATDRHFRRALASTSRASPGNAANPRTTHPVLAGCERRGSRGDFPIRPPRARILRNPVESISSKKQNRPRLDPEVQMRFPCLGDRQLDNSYLAGSLHRWEAALSRNWIK